MDKIIEDSLLMVAKRIGNLPNSGFIVGNVLQNLIKIDDKVDLLSKNDEVLQRLVTVALIIGSASPIMREEAQKGEEVCLLLGNVQCNLDIGMKVLTSS